MSCAGVPHVVSEMLKDSRGHTLMVLIDSDDVFMVLCTKCGNVTKAFER